MVKKILIGSAGVITGVGLLVSKAFGAALTTTTLGTSIDNVNATFYDYFLVLLDKYWPFIVGAGILILVWHFGRRLLTAFR
jgi:hypothetical protein